MSRHMQRAAKLWLLLCQPTKQQFERLFDEDRIEDVRKNDIFDSIREKIRNLQDFHSEFFKCICENETDIAKDPHLKDLVREFTDINLDTSKFYHGLSKSLSMEKTRQDIIAKVLQNVAPGSPPLSEAQLNKVKEKFMDFLRDEDPFKDLHQQYEPLLERYEQMRKKLQEKIENLRRKRKSDRAWNIVLGTILAVVTAAAAVTCVVVVVVAPPTAPVVAAAMTLYAASMGFLGEMMLSRLKEEKMFKEAEELAEKIKKHTSANVVGLKQITNSVEGLNRFRAPILLYVQTYMQDHDIQDLADIAKEIKKLQEPLLQKLDDLRKDVDLCIKELEGQIKHLKPTLT